MSSQKSTVQKWNMKKSPKSLKSIGLMFSEIEHVNPYFFMLVVNDFSYHILAIILADKTEHKGEVI